MWKRKADEVIVLSDSDEDDIESECSGTDEDEVVECPQEADEPVESDEEACELVERGPTTAGDFSYLQKLKVTQLKSYLRAKGLRITGKKDELVTRIQLYLTMKEQDVKGLYPHRSFSINCTGDVCQGDLVLFRHDVFPEGSYDADVRGTLMRPIGTRTVAARVVSESYGKKRQQHTFTLEVLWTEGVKPLTLMQQLQIKGRNLYRHTMRQPWADEAQRAKVLSEKHDRGDAARALKRGRRGGGLPKKPRREQQRLGPGAARHHAAAASISGGPSQPVPYQQPLLRAPEPSVPATIMTHTNNLASGNVPAPRTGAGPAFPAGGAAVHPRLVDHLPNPQQPASLRPGVARSQQRASWPGPAAAAPAASYPAAVAPAYDGFYSHPAQAQFQPWRHAADPGLFGLPPHGLPPLVPPGRYAPPAGYAPRQQQVSYRPPGGSRQCVQPGCTSLNAVECVSSRCGRCCKDRRCGRHWSCRY